MSKGFDFGRKPGVSHIWISYLLILVILLSTLFGFTALDYVHADTVGIVNAEDGLFVRSGPGTGYEAIGGLAHQTKITIIATEGGWYKINYGSGTGYVNSDYVKIESSGSDSGSPATSAFEQSISGFPDSYKPYLRILHNKYPTWKFKPQNTGIPWDSAISKESSPVYINLVPSTWAKAYKSYDKAALNANGTHRVFDSGGYVAASVAAIKYYMDPRNFLNENSVFQFLSNRYDTTTTDAQYITGINQIVSGSFMDKSKGFPEATYQTYAHAILAAGKQSGVNPMTLASMILVEQGYRGTSDLISGKATGYKNYFNYFNIGAYAAGGASAVTNGLKYAKSAGWNTRAKAIMGGAASFARNYVNSNKDTIYLKKFNVMNGLSQVGTMQYMSAVYAANSEGSALRNGYTGLFNTAITFNIPVYLNMPAAACPVPTDTSGGSDNNSGNNSGSNPGSTTTTPTPTRIFGDNRYKTSIASAEKFKQVIGATRLGDVIVACGTNFPDALSAAYLASVKNAPILLVSNSTIGEIAGYIKSNISPNGKVYIMGGYGVISSSLEQALSGVRTCRVYGKDRYVTNIEVLKSCGVSTQELIVCSGKNFADALSASSLGKPVFLVGDRLTKEQLAYLETIRPSKIYIIGGTGAVNQNIQNALSKYAGVTRISGANRYETSANLAKAFYPSGGKTVLLVYGKNFPDGLCAGPIANKLKAPLLLATDSASNNAYAKSYAQKGGCNNVFVFGGKTLISDASAKAMYK